MSMLPSAGTDTPALATATAASEAIAATAASAAASAFAAPPLDRRSFFALLRKSPDLVIGAALLLLHLTLIILGPFATPYPYTEFHMTDALKPPSWQYWFGTDQFGRDVFSRVVYGAHGTLLLSTAATALGVGLGVSIGMAVGYRGGRVDEFVMRIMDGMLSFPSLLLAMLIMSSLGPSRINVIIAIMIVFIPRSTRVLRSVTLGLKNLEFVEAAKVRGESAFWVITRELLPNALGPIVVELAIRLSFAILLSTSLGFIGIGVQPPEPDWGLMVSEGRQYLQTAPWLMFFPALAISTAVIGANLFGDGIGARLAYRGGTERPMSAVLQSNPSDPVLRVDDLSVEYRTRGGNVRAVRDVSFSIGRGETFGVVGESGSGKSTLAFAVMGYLSSNAQVSSGRIDYQGNDLLAMPRERWDALRGARIAMVYQDPMSSLNPSIIVGEQVAEAITSHQSVSAKVARDRTLELFAAVNMPEPTAIFRRYPHQLSGGQQQRVLIAMALANNPDLLIMDEPTTGLDVTTEAQILDLIAELKRSFSSAILYISHNLGVIARISDRIGVMYAGQMVEQGPVREVFRRQLHPYTAGLLECLPSLDFGRKDRALKLIEGMIPDLARLPAACSFAPRCPHARERCHNEAPALLEVVPAHLSRCMFWREQEIERAQREARVCHSDNRQ